MDMTDCPGKITATESTEADVLQYARHAQHRLANPSYQIHSLAAPESTFTCLHACIHNVVVANSRAKTEKVLDINQSSYSRKPAKSSLCRLNLTTPTTRYFFSATSRLGKSLHGAGRVQISFSGASYTVGTMHRR